MNTLYLAIISVDDDAEHAVFEEKEDAEAWLYSYMQEHFEYYTDELDEDANWKDWEDITDFEENLELKNVRLNP